MSYRAILDEALASKSMEIRPILEIRNPIQICELVKKTICSPFCRISLRRTMCGQGR